MDMRRRQFLWGSAVITGGTLLGFTVANLVTSAEGETSMARRTASFLMSWSMGTTAEPTDFMTT